MPVRPLRVETVPGVIVAVTTPVVSASTVLTSLTVTAASVRMAA